MEIREIDKPWQDSNPELPFYISLKLVDTLGRYYTNILGIIDGKTGLLIKKIKMNNFFQFMISYCRSYLILIDDESIKFLDLDGNKVWRQLKLDEKLIGSMWIINKDNKLCFFNVINKLFSIQQN